ncbi:hypothetical protein ACHWQZ_G002653 [Mnemiopsis leidyi]
MDEIETSLIVSGRGRSVSVMFDRPVSVKGKSIGIKSVSFVNEKTKVISYKVRVLDSMGVIHTLSLPRFRWVSTDQLMGAIYKAFSILYETLMNSNYETNPEIIPSRIQRPSFKPAIATPGIYYTAIYYGNSGLKIVPGSWSTDDDVFTLFRPEFSRSDNDKLAFVDHVIEYPNADDGSEGKPLHLMAEPVFLLCDTIRPTYVGKTKQQASSTATDVADYTLIENPEIIEPTAKKRCTSAKKTIKAKRSKKEVISKDVVAGDVI